MAQCIAASAGANEKASDSKIKLGFLLGTRKYHPNVAFFNVGDMLIVSASRLIIDASGLSVFDCKISNQNDPETILATAKINVYQPTDTDNYLQAPKDKENNE
jgi:predicted hotdog family 3-hydroxylacyl-ACP dehydratase